MDAWMGLATKPAPLLTAPEASPRQVRHPSMAWGGFILHKVISCWISSSAQITALPHGREVRDLGLWGC